MDRSKVSATIHAARDRNNNSINVTPRSENRNTNRILEDNRSSPKNRNYGNRRNGQKDHLTRGVQVAPREIARGAFKMISSVSATHFVALETGWEKDMENLAQGLEDFASVAKCGVEKMDAALIYACKEPGTGKWRRCRKVAEEGAELIVELVDIGGPMVVTNDQILFLSQLYRDWSIKSVDFFLDGYRAASGATECFREIDENLLNKTFEITYFRERTGPLTRDHVRVQEMKLNGKLVLDELVRDGLLLKRQPPQEKPSDPDNTPQRPITKSVNTPRTPRPASSLPSRKIPKTPSETRSMPAHSVAGSTLFPKEESLNQKTPATSVPAGRPAVPANVSGRHSSQRPESLTPPLERLSVVDAAPVRNLQFNESSLKLQAMERLVGGRAVQQMISDRIAAISAELNKSKMYITGLSVHPAAAENELRHHRRTAQRLTQDLEDIIQLASSETLDAYRLTAWAQFVGQIWSPMMNILFFNAQPLGVYKNSVLRRAEIDRSSSVEEDPKTTVIVERVIDPAAILKFVQDLVKLQKTARIHRVFFSEDNSKAFIILACTSAEESLDESGRRAVDFLLRSGIIQ